MSNKELGTSAYVVLGLTLQAQEITPYDLKKQIARSVGYFWAFSHPQIYTVTERLNQGGYLSKRQESGGRRRKLYRVTARGRKAFEKWLATPEQSHTELRDLAMLKLYFGEYADHQTISAMANNQAVLHQARQQEYKRIPKEREITEYALMTLQLGIQFEEIAEQHWRKVAADFDKQPAGKRVSSRPPRASNAGK